MTIVQMLTNAVPHDTVRLPGEDSPADALTGLPTRVRLEAYLGAHARRGATQQGAVGVFYIDIDRLRSVNDGFGHETGDELLRCVARRLQSLLGPADFAARFGGDSFVVVCPGLAGERDAIHIAEQILASATEPVGTSAGTFSLALSVGVALAVDTTSAAHLLRDSGTAMHQVKKQGGRGYAIFDPAIRGRLMREVEIERELRLAISQGELCLHYQPVVSLRTGEVLSLEALVRWEHPHRGLLPPSEFIPIAERTGLIVELGQWALRSACRQIAVWTLQPQAPEWASVAVNVSAVQLDDPLFVAKLRAAISDSGIDPQRLAIEVTETALMESATTAASVIAELKALGIRVVLDDFGTGYSSLGHLARFPVDTIKLDRSFISGEAAERSAPIVEAVAGMAHALGIELVGEGVETVDQLEMLRSIGCDHAQGFHFARPMSGERVPAWIAAARETPGLLPAPSPLPHEPAATDWLSLGAAADALSVSPSTLRRWADEGRVRSRRTEGGHRRFALGDVRDIARGRTSEPRLRAGLGITAPLPGLGSLLAAEAGPLLACAGKGLYERFAPGWFAAERSQRALNVWLDAVAGAARCGDLDIALEATTTLAVHAEASGASPLEISLFLERFAALAGAAARSTQAGGERIETQRFFSRIRQQPLRTGAPSAAAR